jgi:gentisate 1,2-dioxygenase
VDLDQGIAEAIRWSDTRRQILINASATRTPLTGGLELALAKIGIEGFPLTTKNFRIVSIRKGQAQVNIGPSRVQVGEHDHFGVPAGIDAYISQIGSDPLITLDSMIVNTT